MSSHKLRVTPKVRGEIVIPSINYPIQSGHTVMLEEEDFQQSDIQASLKNGFLAEEPLNEDVFVPEGAFEEEFEDDEMIDIPLEPNVPKKKKGKVLFRNKNDKGQDINEVVQNINAKTAAYDADNEIDPRDFDGTNTSPLVWDGSNQQALTAQEGRKKVMRDLSSFEMEVQSGEVQFENTAALPKKQVKTAKKRKPTKTASKTLPVPDLGDISLVFETPESDDDSALVFETPGSNEDIGFVDQEQAVARIAKHPVLSKKTKKTKKAKKTRVKKAKMNEEIE